MSISTLFLLILVLTVASYYLGRSRALAQAHGRVQSLHSLPTYYGWFSATAFLLPAVAVLFLWVAFGNSFIDGRIMAGLKTTLTQDSHGHFKLLLNDVHNIASGVIKAEDPNGPLAQAATKYKSLQNQGIWATTSLAVGLGLIGALLALRLISPDYRARQRVEKILTQFLIACSTLAILTTAGIVFSLIFEAYRFFERVPIQEFLFSTNWSPQTAMRSDQVGSSGSFGSVPLVVGTLLITFIAMLVAVPIGLMSAIFMTQYASRRWRKIIKPLLEVLAGIPTVVYGFFAALVVAPFFRGLGESIGISVASESAMTAGIVMGIMIIPFVSSLSDDAIAAVPRTLRDGSYALGATKSETIRQVLIPAALPGIVGAVLLAVSRAIGETMIVVMAAGLSANLTFNPLEAVTTVTVQIVALLTGDQEFDSSKTLSAFALGLLLFTVTLALNVVALRVVRKYRETYE
ncbi:phosphate ABC transporter permease subunit PstC [Govanella unica]|uniref:Phosphate transport system permease protein n=1 Tax=Govanella unica TaxID=2975056 RepID=A0A9X3TXP8_9PROT|nr:phosphate ABC transporter permease subunit PstC [Govania unica]MDA5193615.1 phosphate ABC transporter permease subunit PstC [Govania unica]